MGNIVNQFIRFQKKLENQAQDLHVEEDEDINAGETNEESDNGDTLEPEWDPFGEEERPTIGDDGIPSSQCSRNIVR